MGSAEQCWLSYFWRGLFPEVVPISLSRHFPISPFPYLPIPLSRHFPISLFPYLPIFIPFNFFLFRFIFLWSAFFLSFSLQVSRLPPFHSSLSSYFPNGSPHFTLPFLHIFPTDDFPVTVTVPVTVQHLHRVKYLCDYGTDNCNPVCPGIKGVTLDVQMRAFLLLQQAE